MIQCSACPNRYMPLRRALIDLRSGRPRTPDSENWKSNKGKKRRRQLAKKRTASKFCKRFMMVHAPKLSLWRDMVAVARSGRRPRKHRRRAAKRNPKPKPKARSKTLLASASHAGKIAFPEQRHADLCGRLMGACPTSCGEVAMGHVVVEWSGCLSD